MTDVSKRSGGVTTPSSNIVSRDTTLTGDGTAYAPLAVANPAGGVPFSSETITIYARLDGSDQDGIGTLSAPYRTFQRAIIDVPAVISPGRRYVVDITGLGVESLPEDYQIPVMSSPIYQAEYGDQEGFPYFFAANGVTIRAAPQLVTSLTEADAVVTAGSVTSNVDTNLTILTITTPRAAWASVDLRGKQVIKTNGPNQATCCIYDSDATHLYLCNNSSNFNDGDGPLVLGAGGELQIVEPSATLRADPVASGFPIQCMGASSINFQGIRFETSDPTASNGFSLAIGNTPNPFFEACDVGGIFSVQIADEIALHSTKISVVMDCEATALVMFNCYVSNINQYLYLVGGIQDFKQTVLDGVPTLSSGVFVGPIPTPNWGFQECLITGSQGDAIKCVGGLFDLVDVRIDDATGSAINAESASNYVALTHVTGSGNAGFGVKANDGAQVQVRDVITTVTGAAGDMKSGSQLPRTWSNFNGVNPIGNEYDLVTPFVADSNGVLKPRGIESGAPCTGTRIFRRVP